MGPIRPTAESCRSTRASQRRPPSPAPPDRIPQAFHQARGDASPEPPAPPAPPSQHGLLVWAISRWLLGAGWNQLRAAARALSKARRLARLALRRWLCLLLGRAWRRWRLPHDGHRGLALALNRSAPYCAGGSPDGRWNQLALWSGWARWLRWLDEYRRALAAMRRSQRVLVALRRAWVGWRAQVGVLPLPWPPAVEAVTLVGRGLCDLQYADGAVLADAEAGRVSVAASCEAVWCWATACCLQLAPADKEAFETAAVLSWRSAAGGGSGEKGGRWVETQLDASWNTRQAALARRGGMYELDGRRSYEAALVVRSVMSLALMGAQLLAGRAMAQAGLETGGGWLASQARVLGLRQLGHPENMHPADTAWVALLLLRAGLDVREHAAKLTGFPSHPGEWCGGSRVFGYQAVAGGMKSPTAL